MADRKQFEESKINALYSWLSYDLQKIKTELLNEMKYSSVQVGSLCNEIKNDKDKSSQAISQEIRYSYKQNQTIYDGLAKMLTKEVGERLNSMDEKVHALEEMQATLSSKMDELSGNISEEVKEKVESVVPQLEEAITEIKYGYVQQQAVYDGIMAILKDEVVTKVDDIDAKLSSLEQMDNALAQIQEKLGEGIALFEENVSEQNRQMLDAVAAIPVPENVDYTRIADEVGDKVLELLGETLPQPIEPEKVDYEKIVYGTAEKVVESLPYPEKIDYERLAAAVAEKVVLPEVAPAEVDYEKLSDMVVAKMPAIDYDKLSDMVAAKLAANIDQSYDVLLDEVGIEQISEKVAQKLELVEATDYDRIAAIVEEKVNAKTSEDATYELVIDEDGLEAIAKSVSQELCQVCGTCQCAPAQTTEETVEETVEEVVEVVEEPVEEVVEEVVKEPVEEVVEELAASEAVEQPAEQELVDVSDAGLVERLNRSFTAKMKQNADTVKSYYSGIKNALLSYKKVNSHVSWSGDRFNYGRNTVAKLLIRGKTLCLLLALDPEDEETFPTSVYHQRNFGDQKAHEDTPFMVRITSAGALKKAIRLVDALAGKFETVKEDDYQPVDYTEEFVYETDDQLIQAGLIKKSLEKKVDFNF